MHMTLDDIQSHLERAAMLVRGAFYPSEDSLVPSLSNGLNPSTVVLVGNAGTAMWKKFRSAEEFHSQPDPMNRWTQRVLTKVADDLGAGIVFPFGGPPHYPFQRWAQLAEPVHSSPIGILIHPTYGLWHAYRGALLFAEKFPIPELQKSMSPCLDCREQPCLTTCPVEAFSVQGYAVERCSRYLDDQLGNDCMTQGCRARRACPVTQTYIYEPEHAEFHMSAFAAARRKSS